MPHLHQIPHNQHKFLIGISAVAILIVGLIVGGWLVSSLDQPTLETVKIALLFSMIIVLLIISSMVAEIKHILIFSNKKK